MENKNLNKIVVNINELLRLNGELYIRDCNILTLKKILKRYFSYQNKYICFGQTDETLIIQELKSETSYRLRVNTDMFKNVSSLTNIEVLTPKENKK